MIGPNYQREPDVLKKEVLWISLIVSCDKATHLPCLSLVDHDNNDRSISNQGEIINIDGVMSVDT